ncbi:peptidase S13 [Thiohalocapsa marina]|uniref:Peptidase S13 n=1 Tax=Thiohalocapsa marina TaxID=424902 RepID=A0A5M8FN63_9GAMM|nr:D-alanyl-D-alanine carboxypeptidase [Thiohalocapsa marina]KAA6186217.1 peptidase S13 [Thiohalocapsa marina]
MLRASIVARPLAAAGGLLLWLAAGVSGADAIGEALGLAEASLVVQQGPNIVLADQADRPMIPASTMKLVTALAAIEHWGLSHRFTTAIYRDHDNRLWIKGGGDPYLVAEELDLLVAALREQGLRTVTGIGLDDGLFAADDRIPGRSDSDNPYDAPVTALAVNFNTVYLRVAAGHVSSAEAQTPVTATAQRLGATMGNGRHRINLRTRDNALYHFGEVFQAKLQAAGVDARGDVRLGSVPAGARRLLVHENTRTLETVVEDMLAYSTNFVANSLFLALGERHGRSSMAQSQQSLERWARARFGWREFRIEDGAGLSRGNRLSGRQLLDVLQALEPYRALLPRQDDNPAVRAKTGTLSGVSAYAGWARRDGDWLAFSLLINQPVDYGFRLRVANALTGGATLARN